MAGTYDFAEQLLASQRKFAEDLLKAAAPLAPGRAESAPATETYKPGQVVPRDGTVECARHHDVQNHVKAGTDSHRALITMSIVRAVPGNTSRRQYAERLDEPQHIIEIADPDKAPEDGAGTEKSVKKPLALIRRFPPAAASPREVR